VYIPGGGAGPVYIPYLGTLLPAQYGVPLLPGTVPRCTGHYIEGVDVP